MMDFRVIKENDYFLLTDVRGDIPAENPEGLGFYTRDTRFLSRFELLVNGQKPVVLHSAADQNYMARILLINPNPKTLGEDAIDLARESVTFERTRLIYDGILYEKLVVTNYDRRSQTLTFTYAIDADFADMFVVRGFAGGETGTVTDRVRTAGGLVVRYEGKDGITRETVVAFSQPATAWDDEGHHFRLALDPGASYTLTVTVTPVVGGERGTAVSMEVAMAALQRSYAEWMDRAMHVETDNAQLNRLLHRSLLDLRVLTTDLGDGPFPVAGIPWYAVPFGRDSLITAWQALAFQPEMARGTLLTLARLQGKREDPWRDEQPGKIPHEMRYGELANTNQIPFTPYYGTIDATPLFLILAAEYYRWTGDRELMERLLPNILAALEWIDRYGDRDGDGFVEYLRESARGLGNQGWKDSGDCIVYRDGRLAEGAIALCEVQGYVYEAKTRWSTIFAEWGDAERAKVLADAAETLKRRFAAAFWMDDEQYVALALDGHKRRVDAVTSNPGHLLFTGILDDEQAARVKDRLMQSDLFSGYGIRTLSAKERAYNPVSYHNGSVWPHDNSLIVLGLARRGFTEAAHRVIAGMLRASEQVEHCRLPELFCGFSADDRLVPYPVACSPQAWAAGTPLLFVRALLGIEPDIPNGKIVLAPSLPPWMSWMRVRRMRIGSGELSFDVIREGGVLSVRIETNTTGTEVRVQPTPPRGGGVQ